MEQPLIVYSILHGSNSKLTQQKTFKFKADIVHFVNKKREKGAKRKGIQIRIYFSLFEKKYRLHDAFPM